MYHFCLIVTQQELSYREECMQGFLPYSTGIRCGYGSVEVARLGTKVVQGHDSLRSFSYKYGKWAAMMDQ